jgi:uncharacterized protein YigE (DUF2233 family)
MSERMHFNGISFDTYCVDYPFTGIRFVWKDKENRIMGSIRNAIENLARENRKVVFAMNGGIYSGAHEPLGLYIEDYTKIREVNRRNGEGNFYLLPNGVFALTDDGPCIIKTDDYKDDDKIRYAVQSGPLLVIDGMIHPSFNQISLNKTVRNGVGVSNDDKVFFAVANDAVNLYDFALFFRDTLSCNNALYLDGYVSRMYLPELDRYQGDGDCASIIVVVE